MTTARVLEPSQSRPLSLSRSVALLVLALIPTIFTAVQPLVIDDPYYLDYARHFRLNPLDPYGGGRMDLLVPPVLPYWGAATMLLAGDSIPLLKLALYPFAILLTFSFDALARRFARGLENFVVVTAVLSPYVLPAFNYMLDVPAYGLGLAALALFVTGCDRGAWRLVALSGLVAGIAMETKYNLAVIPAGMFAYGVIHRRYAQGAVACAIATAFFIGCEAAIMAKYGQSHFLFHIHGRATWTKLGGLAYGLVGFAGGLTAWLIPLGLLGLKARTAWIVGALIACAVALAAIGTGHDDWLSKLVNASSAELPTMAHLSGLFGVALIAVVGRLLALSLVDRDQDQDKQSIRFLAVWLVIEMVGCLVINPWPAARRYMGIFFVTTLIVGRVAANRLRFAPEQRFLLAPIGALGLAAGLVCWLIGYVDATNARSLAYLAAAKAKIAAPPGRPVWVWARFGAGYYSEQAGLTPVGVSQVLQPGDVFVLFPMLSGDRWDVSALQEIETLSAGTNLGATITPSYAGDKRPVTGAADTRPIAIIYRARDTTRIEMRNDS